MFPDDNDAGCCTGVASFKCSWVIVEPSCSVRDIVDPCCLVLVSVSCSSGVSSTAGAVRWSTCSLSAAFLEFSTSSGAGNANGGC